MIPDDRSRASGPEPWSEEDRRIAERPSEGAWLGADEPDRFGEEILEHLSRVRLASLFLDSPAFMAVLEGPDHTFVNVNPAYYRLVGRRRLLGRTVREAFPDLADTDHFAVLDEVFESGERHVGAERTLELIRSHDEPPEPVHVSFVYHPLEDDDGSAWGTLVHGIDLTERWRARRTLRRRARQQAAIAGLGQEALEGTGLEELIRSACGRITEELGAERAAFLERGPEGEQLVLRTGAGWSDQAVGAAVPADRTTPEGSALEEREPVAVTAGDEEKDGVLPGPDGKDSGSVSILAASVRSGETEPTGVLAAYDDEPRVWDQEETDFLQALAHLLGTSFAWRESERQLATVAENLPGVLYRCRNERDWPMEFLSGGMRELSGWSATEILGENGPDYGKLIQAEDRERVWKSVQEASEHGRPYQLLYRIETREGEQRWVWEQGRVVKPTTGTETRLEGCILDVTEWKEAEEEAERSARLFEATFRSLDDAVFIVRLPEREIEACNPAAERMLGWSVSELVGSCTERLHLDREHYGLFDREGAAALENEGVFRTEYRLQRKDGTVIDTEHVVSHVGDGGESGRAVSIVRDITERKERERQLREERERFRQVAENVREVFWLRTPDFEEVLYVNPAYEEVTGQSAESLQRDPTSWLELVHPEDRHRVREAAESDTEAEFAEEYRIVRPDGEVRWIRDRAYPVEDERGEVVRVVGVAEDITERKIAERERRRAEERYETLFRVTPTAVSVATLEDGRFLEVNEAFEKLYGWDRDEVIGRTADDLSLWNSEMARDRIVERLGDLGEVRDIEVQLRARSGKRLEVAFAAELLEIDGTECMLASAHDLTERKGAERELERLALRDTLTGLPNRTLFLDRLHHALRRAERQETRVAVLFLDLDRFKVVNDTLGHSAGDKLLEQVALRIRECFRDEDTVARLGGDEFAGLLEDVDDHEEAEKVAARVTEALRSPFELTGTEVHVDVSIGIALGDESARPEDLLRFSDVAMYRVKRSERTGYHVFDPDVDEVETQRLHRENQLREAIELGQLRLEFQPIVRLRDGRIIGAEALVRWEHPERGRLPPGEFIPLAEETGLVVPIGRWVLEETCRLGARWMEMIEDDDPVTFGVNISARQYQQTDFVETVAGITAEVGLPLSALALEITESVQLTGRGKLQTLRGQGLRVAIDDFGTGYSSLHYLRHLEADTLKVDRTFIADLDVDPRETVLVQAILLMARQMGLDVVAEGIETAEQLDHLRELGCPYGQGFHLGRPMPPEAFEDLLETGHVAV